MVFLTVLVFQIKQNLPEGDDFLSFPVPQLSSLLCIKLWYGAARLFGGATPYQSFRRKAYGFVGVIRKLSILLNSQMFLNIGHKGLYTAFWYRGMGVYPLLPKGGHTAPYRWEQSRGFLLWPTRFPGLAVSHSSLSTAYHFKRLFSLPPSPSATESGCGLLPAKCVWLPLAASQTLCLPHPRVGKRSDRRRWIFGKIPLCSHCGKM